MEGPTVQGIEELIARDPGAHWNDSINDLEGTAFLVVTARACFQFHCMTRSSTTPESGTAATPT